MSLSYLNHKAAGICLRRSDGKMLFADEHRLDGPVHSQHNFLGGKKENNENAYQTAFREFIEETALDANDVRSVALRHLLHESEPLWIQAGQYYLFLIQTNTDDFDNLPDHFLQEKKKHWKKGGVEAERLTWASWPVTRPSSFVSSVGTLDAFKLFTTNCPGSKSCKIYECGATHHKNRTWQCKDGPNSHNNLCTLLHPAADPALAAYEVISDTASASSRTTVSSSIASSNSRFSDASRFSGASSFSMLSSGSTVL